MCHFLELARRHVVDTGHGTLVSKGGRVSRYQPPTYTQHLQVMTTATATHSERHEALATVGTTLTALGIVLLILL